MEREKVTLRHARINEGGGTPSPKLPNFFINFYSLAKYVIIGIKICTTIQKGRLSSSVFCDQSPFVLMARARLLLLLIQWRTQDFSMRGVQ